MSRNSGARLTVLHTDLMIDHLVVTELSVFLHEMPLVASHKQSLFEQNDKIKEPQWLNIEILMTKVSFKRPKATSETLETSDNASPCDVCCFT